MKRKIIIIVSIILVIIIFMKAVQLFAGGSLGLRPTTHGCWGLKIDSKKIHKIFPSGDFCFSILIDMCYRINLGADRQVNNYCLGQDVWLGE